MKTTLFVILFVVIAAVTASVTAKMLVQTNYKQARFEVEMGKRMYPSLYDGVFEDEVEREFLTYTLTKDFFAAAFIASLLWIAFVGFFDYAFKVYIYEKNESVIPFMTPLISVYILTLLTIGIICNIDSEFAYWVLRF